mgnify:CR=1 FL=1
MNKKCFRCKKEFFSDRKNKIYCCRTCKQAASVYRICGANCNSKRKRLKRLGLTKKINCAICGFKPVNICQLDMDHIDGNSLNNNISNIQILCANCHRLKTIMNKDWKNNKVY